MCLNNSRIFGEGSASKIYLSATFPSYPVISAAGHFKKVKSFISSSLIVAPPGMCIGLCLVQVMLHAHIQKGFTTLTTLFFKMMREERIQMPLKADHHRPASETFRWRNDDSPILNAGLVALYFFRRSGAVLLRNPVALWFFCGGLDPLSPPPLDLRMCCIILCVLFAFAVI